MPTGEEISGVLEAYDEFEAADQIRETCPVITKLSKSESRVKIDLFAPLTISEKTLAILCSQFAVIIRSGIPIVHAVELIAEQTRDRGMKKILQEVAKDVGSGHGLAESYENKAKIMPLTFIETVRAGEESGTLEQSFDKLHAYFDKTGKMKAKLRTAMISPFVLAIVAVFVVVAVIMFAVPTFTSMFDEMGQELPWATRSLMSLYEFLHSYLAILAIGVVALIISLKLWSKKSERGRRFFANLTLRIPRVGTLAIMNGASQFANTMATMLGAGLPAMRAVVITGRVMTNYVLGLSVAACAAGIEEGKRISDCIRESRWLPPMLVEMTGVGEESGSLEETLNTIGAFYDNEAQRLMNNAVALLEPIIIVILGLIVAFILIGLYTPMFGMYGGVGL